MISRREWLHHVSIAGIGLPLGSLYPQSDLQAPIKISNPVFSHAERDRRWQAVRRIMAKPQWDLEAIIALGNAASAYTQYLTQIGGRAGSADVIFPRDGSKPVFALVGAARNRSYWETRLKEWSDGKLVVAEGEGSSPLIERLRGSALNKPGTRLGVAKLTGTRFEPEGTVPATYLDNLKAALPGVVFVPIEKWGPDAGPIEEPAMVKSVEEQEVIKQSVAVGEKAMETIVRFTRGPVRRQADIWFPAFMTLFRETGEAPSRLSISLNSPANSTLGSPVDDPVREGQIISEEINATVQGYRAQVNHSIFIGGQQTPGFNYYKAAMETAVKVLLDTVAFIVPGKTNCGQLVDHYSTRVARENAEDRSGVVLHSGGIGDLSRPRLGPSNSREDSNIVLLPGMTFDFKPAIRMKREVIQDVGKENRAVQIGEHFLVTENGAIRLGRRELKPLTTGG